VRLIEAVEGDHSCESCGRRCRTLVGIDLLDGSEPFEVCVSCADAAVNSTCRVRLVEVEG
jgi:hypothetical protein